MPDDNASMWNVFISHSTNGTNGVALRTLDLLEKALPPTYNPMIDRHEIGLGDNWREWIIRRLQDAHLGIALLDAKALESKWVPFECQILHTKPGECRRLLPVLIGISRASIRTEERYSQYQYLLDRQIFVADEPDDEAAKDAEAARICATIMERLIEFSAGLCQEDVDLIRRLTYSFALRDGDAERLTKRHFRKPVDDNKVLPFFPDELLAKRLLDAQLDRPALGAVKDLSFVRDRGPDVRPILLSSWITWQEAEPVRPEGPDSGPRVLVLQTESPLVAEQFVQRANGCLASMAESIALDPAADGETWSVGQMVADLFGPSKYLYCSPGEDGRCFHAEYPRYVIVKVVGGLEMSVKVAEEIHRKCPSIPVLLLVAPSIYQDCEARIRELLGSTYRHVGHIDQERQEYFLSFAHHDLCETFKKKGIA